MCQLIVHDICLMPDPRLLSAKTSHGPIFMGIKYDNALGNAILPGPRAWGNIYFPYPHPTHYPINNDFVQTSLCYCYLVRYINSEFSATLLNFV